MHECSNIHNPFHDHQPRPPPQLLQAPQELQPVADLGNAHFPEVILADREEDLTTVNGVIRE